jgi:hypothetical protein
VEVVERLTGKHDIGNKGVNPKFGLLSELKDVICPKCGRKSRVEYRSSPSAFICKRCGYVWEKWEKYSEKI